jgi:hypothetical protein
MSQPTYAYEGIIDPGSGAIRLAQLSGRVRSGTVRGPRCHRQALRLGPGSDQGAACVDTRLGDRRYKCLTRAVRNVRTGRGALRSELRGEVETEDGVLVIGRICSTIA